MLSGGKIRKDRIPGDEYQWQSGSSKVPGQGATHKKEEEQGSTSHMDCNKDGKYRKV